MSDEEIIKTLKFAIAQDEVECIGYWDEKYQWVECSMKDVFDVIQRLQAEKKELKQTKFSNWKLKFFKAQEEIKRLTEENRVVKHNMDFHRNEKFELQKQVDELKAEKLSAVCDLNMRIVELDNELKQAVKDTVDKIVCGLLELFPKGNTFTVITLATIHRIVKEATDGVEVK